LVPLRHLPEAERLAAVRCQAQADEPARLLRHEIDRLRRRELRRDREVSLVLAVGRVHDDHELTLANVLDRLFDRRERALFLDLHQVRSYPGATAAPRTWRGRRSPD